MQLLILWEIFNDIDIYSCDSITMSMVLSEATIENVLVSQNIVGR